MNKTSGQGQNLTWTDYFKDEDKTFFKRLLSLHRKVFISRSVRFYTDKYFPKSGIFLEAGAGTSQSSGRIDKRARTLIAMDFNHYVLAHHNILPHKIQGNIMALPIKNQALDGIWNLGVMEHFIEEEIVDILNEFNRVITKGGRILLFWPPSYAPFQIVLNSISWVAKRLLNKRIDFFPDEVSRYKNKQQVIRVLQMSGFELENIHFNMLDLLSYKIVVARKISS